MITNFNTYIKESVDKWNFCIQIPSKNTEKFIIYNESFYDDYTLTTILQSKFKYIKNFNTKVSKVLEYYLTMLFADSNNILYNKSISYKDFQRIMLYVDNKNTLIKILSNISDIDVENQEFIDDMVEYTFNKKLSNDKDINFLELIFYYVYLYDHYNDFRHKIEMICSRELYNKYEYLFKAKNFDLL